MLSAQQTESIVNKINATVDVPFIGEDTEKTMINAVVTQMINSVAGAVPAEYKGFINDSSKGIDDKTAGDLKTKLTAMLTKQVQLPIGGDQVKKVVDTVVGTIIDGMKKGGKV